MRRVVITGIGLVTPIGNDLETTWSALLAGKNGAAPITQFDCSDFATKFACEVKNWEASKFFDKRELKHVDRFLQFAVGEGMMAGGGEATITVLGVGGFNAMRAMSTRNNAPEKASRPFDKDRGGFVIGEGAGILVLEELEHAKKRGARIYAELTGYAANSDAHHVAAPAPEHRGAQACFRLALKDAKMTGPEIGYINAHGTSPDLNDKNETLAVK